MKTKPLKTSLKDIYALYKQPEIRPLVYFIIMIGVNIALYAGFLYKLVEYSLGFSEV
jgi:hypothetical protein